MSENPVISIICPCFNHGRYIFDMLDSVNAQTFQDYEIIIVNDGSTDNTKVILDGLNQRNLTVIHIRHSGPATARNTAIDAAKAEIILNLDADDKIAPTLLEKAYDAFNSYSNLGIIYSDISFFGDRSGSFQLPPYSLPEMLKENVIHSLAFFRKKDWKTIGGYSDKFVYGLEDYDFWLSIIELGREIHKIPEELVFYRQYLKTRESRSGKRKISREKSLKAYSMIFERHESLFKTCPEVYERALSLTRLVDSETWLFKWLKQFRLTLRHWSEGRL